MKFYKRFVGDIMKKTAGLTMAQMGAYDRLLDHYYATEEPIEPDEVYTVAHAQGAGDRRDVDKVLRKYFVSTELGYTHERADETIAEAQPRIEAARENGKKGGRPSKAKLAARAAIKEPTGLFAGSDSDPNSKTSQSQSQNGSEANASAAGAAPGSVDNPPKSAAEMTKQELWRAGKSLLHEQGLPIEQCGSFVGALVKQYGDEIVVGAVRATIVAGPADAKEYLKATCMRAKGERRDPVTVPSDDAEKTKARNAADDALIASQDPAVRAQRIADARAKVAALSGKKAEETAA